MHTTILSHYEKFWGPGSLFYKNTDPKLAVDLVWFPANAATDFHRIATIGLSDKIMPVTPGAESERRQEFIIYLPKQWSVNLNDKESPSTWACMFIFFAGRYIVDRDIWLHPGSILHTEDSRHPTFFRYPFALVMPPLGEKPEFSPLKLSNETINLNVLMLITNKESEFLKAHGLKVLMEKMLERETIYPVMDPFRPCTFDVTDTPQAKDARVEGFDMALRQEAVEEHCAKHFGVAPKVLDIQLQGVGDRAFALLVFAPTKERPFYTVVTRGISNIKQKVEGAFENWRRVELLLYFSMEESSDINNNPFCRILNNLARTAFAGNLTARPGMRISNGEPPKPLVENSALTTVEFLWPLFETPDFDTLSVDSNESPTEPLRFCQILLLSTREVQFSTDAPVIRLRKMEGCGTLDQVLNFQRPCTFDLIDKGQKRSIPFRVRSPNLSIPAEIVAGLKSETAASVSKGASEQSNDAAAERQKHLRMGCILSTIIFVALISIVGSDAFDRAVPKHGVLIGASIAFALWIIFPFLYARIIGVLSKPAAPHRVAGTVASSAAQHIEIIDQYLKTWDEFAQGANEKVAILNANQSTFESALSDALLKRDRRAPGRLVFFAVVQVGVPISCDGKIGRAFRAMVGDSVPTTTDEGKDVYFPADVYFWWQENKSKYDLYPLFEEWSQRDFAKRTVIPMYEKLK